MLTITIGMAIFLLMFIFALILLIAYAIDSKINSLEDRIILLEDKLSSFIRITNKELKDTEIGLQDLEERVEDISIRYILEQLEKNIPKTKSNVKKESGKKSTTKKV